MPSFDAPRLLDALSAPMGDLIAAVGRNVAEAQTAMDAHTIESLKQLYQDDTEVFSVLRDIGYRPTWYHIPEVTAEISMALTISGENTEPGSGGSLRARSIRLYSAPVDAAYSSRYNYELKGATVVKFRIVPIPASPVAAELRVVPDVIGRTFAAAKTALAAAGLDYTYDAKSPPAEATTVAGQSPAPGAVVTASQVVLTFAALTQSDPPLER